MASFGGKDHSRLITLGKMKNYRKLILFAVLIIAVNVTTTLVVSYNQRAHLYPDNADSIVIPIFSTLILSLLALPFLLLLIIFPNSLIARKYIEKGWLYRTAVCSAIVGLYVICAALSFLGFAYWFIPHHYILGLVFAIFLICLTASLVLDFRKLFSNKSALYEMGGNETEPFAKINTISNMEERTCIPMKITKG